jgi:threonyl-tRNA synthetase
MKDHVSDVVKHSASHILATAVQRIYPYAKVGIGPVTKDGFYYDFDFEGKITKKDLEKIENLANQITGEDLPFQQVILSKEAALNMLLQRGQIYKAELLKSIPDAEVSFYKTGEEFIDLCRGPHVASTKSVGFIKLLKFEEVHWQNQTDRPKLVRIYGKAFNSFQEYLNYAKTEEEIKNRDFISISKRLNLANKEGNILVLSEYGTFIYNEIKEVIEDSLRDENTREILLPFIPASKISELNKYIKSIALVKNRSEKDYPLYFIGTLNSDETMIRGANYESEDFLYAIVQHKNHSLVTILGEALEKVFLTYKNLDFDISVEILCNNLEDELVGAISDFLQKKVVSHTKIIDNNIDNITLNIMTKDSLERMWEIGKIEITRDASFTSFVLVIDILKLFALLLETTNGKLSAKFAPIQVKILPFGKKHENAADEVRNFIHERGFRSEVDKRAKSIKSKIRTAENEDIPIILIVGDKEVVTNSVSIRQNHVSVGLISMEKVIDYISENLEK